MAWDFVPAVLFVVLFLWWLCVEDQKEEEALRLQHESTPASLQREIWFYIRKRVALNKEQKLELAGLALYQQQNGTDLQKLQRMAFVLRERAKEQGIELFEYKRNA